MPGFMSDKLAPLRSTRTKIPKSFVPGRIYLLHDTDKDKNYWNSPGEKCKCLNLNHITKFRAIK